GGDTVDPDALWRPGVCEIAGQAHGSGLGGAVGRVAAGGMEGGGGADDDNRTGTGLKHVMKACATVHQAVQVDVDHLAEIVGLKLGPIIENDTLAEYQYVKAIKGWQAVLDRLGIRQINLFILQTGEI